MGLKVSQGVLGNIARVQSKSANTAGTNATSKDLVFDSTLTPGNIVIIAWGMDGNNLTSITGTGIIFQGISRTGANVTFNLLAIGRIRSGATATITVASVAAQAHAIVGAEYSCGGILRLDQSATANSVSTSPASGATGTTATAAELWVGSICARGTNANTMSSPTNSFSIVAQTNTTNGTANSDRTVGLFEQIVTATGTPNVGCTITSNNWTAIVAALEETPISMNAFQ